MQTCRTLRVWGCHVLLGVASHPSGPTHHAACLQSDGELVLKPGRQDPHGVLQGGWRNRACDPHMHAAGIPVIQVSEGGTVFHFFLRR